MNPAHPKIIPQNKKTKRLFPRKKHMNATRKTENKREKHEAEKFCCDRAKNRKIASQPAKSSFYLSNMLFLRLIIKYSKVPNSIVIIPTYNEKENIAKIIEKVFSLPEEFNILIIDDNSPDGTAAIVKELAITYKNRLFLVERAGKLGLGTAYIAGFKWALANNYEYIFEMDADFSHNPDDLIRLYEACSHKGSRSCNWITLYIRH